MIVTRTTPRPLPWPALLTFLLPVGCVLWAFGNSLAEMAHAWRNPQSSHGFLVPFFALYLLWHRRGLLADATPRPSWLGLPVLAAGIGLHLYGAYYHYIWLDHVALLPSLAGVWLTCGGKAGWRWGWPSILFLFFMIPLPYRYAIALSGPLQRFAALISTFIMQCVGMPALSEGNIIRLNEHDIDIVEACSGLRMLVVFFALSTAVVLLYKRHWLDKLIIIVSAVPIALVSNVTRIIATGILYEAFTDSATVTAWVHDTADWLMMPLALGLLWAELKLLRYLFIPQPPAPPRGVRPPAPRRAPQAPLTRRIPAAPVKRQPVARAKAGTSKPMPPVPRQPQTAPAPAEPVAGTNEANA
jgi:exosortase